MDGKGEGLSTLLMFYPYKLGQTQHELGRGSGDPDFNSQIDLDLSDGII